jgi:hypothetical protein
MKPPAPVTHTTFFASVLMLASARWRGSVLLEEEEEDKRWMSVLGEEACIYRARLE